jgi:hypothetical protein
MWIQEQKEELVNMDWRELISKRKQIKDRSRQKPQTRMAGGTPVDAKRKKIEPKGSLGDIFEEDMSELAEMTRTDIMDMAMERINQMSKQELIDMLERTEGQLGGKI